MFSGYGVQGAVAFGYTELNPVTKPIAYYSGNRCLDKIVCILLVAFNVLIVSVFLFLYSVCVYFVFYQPLFLYCICILNCNQSSRMATRDQ